MGTYAAPLQELIDRLEYHRGSGRILDGWSLETVPVQDIEGISTLPSIHIYAPTLSERYQPQYQIHCTYDVNLLISTEKAAGSVAFLGDIEKVLDAIEIETDGTTINWAMSGTLLEPIMHRLTQVFVTNIGMHGTLILTFKPILVDRGKRRL